MTDERATRQRRVVEVWSWLPAFRAVAEVEHVQGAARELHVTASSLSRSVRLVEDRLGKKLFDRVGRNVRLNHDGEELLAALRDGMRRIDDGIARLSGTTFSGSIRVACEGDQPVALAWRAAMSLRKRYSSLTVVVEDAGDLTTIAGRLLRGELDVAILARAPANARLHVDPLAEVRYAIYCGRSHPLFAKRAPTLSAICAHAFVGPTEPTGDPWPAATERIVALRLPSLEPAIAACASGELLAVLPEAAVVGRRDLRKLPCSMKLAQPLHAVRRRSLERGPDRATAFVAELG